MKYLKLGKITSALAALILGAGGCATRPDTAPGAAAQNAGSSFDLPASDAGFPGDGPIRRYDWFQNLWRERRTAFAERTGQEKGALVFLGDSITQGWGDDLGGAFGNTSVANRGISGDTTRGVLIRLEQDVLSLSPAGIVLLIGTNDLEENADPETAVANVRLILDAIRRHNSKTPVLLCEVFPSSEKQKRPKQKVLRLNQLYSRLVSEYPQVTLVNTWAIFAEPSGDAIPDEFPDLLHPNEKGYSKWADALRPVLRQKGLLR